MPLVYFDTFEHFLGRYATGGYTMQQFTRKLKDLKPILKLNTDAGYPTLIVKDGMALAFSPSLLASIPCPAFDRPFTLNEVTMDFLPHLAKYHSYSFDLLGSGILVKDLTSDDDKILEQVCSLSKSPTVEFNAEGGLTVSAKLLKILIKAVSRDTYDRLTFERSSKLLKVTSIHDDLLGMLAACRLQHTHYSDAKCLQSMLNLLPAANQASKSNPCTLALRQVGDNIVTFATDGGYLAKFVAPVEDGQGFDGDQYVNSQAKVVPIADKGLSFSDMQSLYDGFTPTDRDSFTCLAKPLLKVLPLFGNRPVRLSARARGNCLVLHLTDGDKLSAIVMAHN